MVENKSSLFGIIAIIIGALGLGFGAFSVVSLQELEGIQGPPGNDVPGGIQVGILDPDYGTEVLGKVTIRALILGSLNYSIAILRNGTQIGSSLPYEWDTSSINDGWWNITVIATDILTNNASSDEVIVYVKNIQDGFICSSEQEINDVLDAHGKGTIIITIVSNIVLTNPIVLNKGGNYTIKGRNVVILCDSDITVFEILNATSCYIYDISIDASTITSDDTPIIYINEVNNIPVYIEDMFIFGDSDKKGQGILIQSDYVLIKDCIFSFLNRGIDSSASYTHIYNNGFYNSYEGIQIDGDYCIIRGNSIGYTLGGIFITGGQDHVINNNHITATSLGIELDYAYNVLIAENFIDSGFAQIFILTMEYTDSAITIYGNVICNGFYGVLMEGADYTYIVNNTFINHSEYHIIWEYAFNIIIVGNVYILPAYLFP